MSAPEFQDDPFPPGVTCTPALQAEFEEWFAHYTAICKAGYWCRPATHIFVAWLAGRDASAWAQADPGDAWEKAGDVGDIISKSADAQQFLRDFKFGGPASAQNHRP